MLFKESTATVAIEIPRRTFGVVDERTAAAVVSGSQSVEHFLKIKRNAVEFIGRRLFACLLHHKDVTRSY